MGNLRSDQIIYGDKEALKQAQATDPKLDSIRRRVDSGNITVSRGLNRGETKFVRKKDVWFDFCFMALQHILGHFGHGQLTYPHCSWASLLSSLPVLSAHSFASN